MSEKKTAKVHYADLWGLREKKHKYLLTNEVQTTKWQELKPVAPYYFFVPKDFALQAEYEKFWKITEIFKMWSSGVKTNRDHFLVDYDKNALTRRISMMVADRLDDEIIKVSFGLKDGKYWNTKREREKIRQNPSWQNQFFPYSYRPFDIRWIFYQPNLIEIGRGGASKELMRHFCQKNLGLTITRQLSTAKFFHSFITTWITDMCLISTKTKETSYIFPLYLFSDELVSTIHESPLQRGRIPNFTPEFLQAIRESLNSEPNPEEIFYCIYAVLYSPTYRKRYEEFLKIDFPRIPLPSNYHSFKKLSTLGKELVDLHLLKHPSLSETEIGFPKGGSNVVEKVKYEEKTQSVHINKEQYFEGIVRGVWEYRIGAYQVMEKYLKDRKKRKLSLDEIDHYMKVAKAIRLTIELQKKIDEVYTKIEI